MRGDSEPVIYLDHHATTPCDPRVLEAMLPYFTENFGNPSSTQHAYGRRAEAVVAAARAEVAALIGARASEIVFTSGATEADNLALFGVVAASRSRGRHVITQVTEHRAVLDACGELERQGCEVTYLVVESDGRVDPDRVAAALRSDTVLVSIMLANNEIGTLQPIAEIAARCRRQGVPLHTDAAQALALVDCHLESLGVDLMSFSAHKAYGPKGIGALYVRRRQPRVRLLARQFGGGHERGRRSGTLDVPSIVGLATASSLVTAERDSDARRLAGLRQRLLSGLRRALPGVEVNGSLEHRLANNLNVSLPGIHADLVLQEVSGVAFSSGAACTSPAGSSSHVLAALPEGRQRADRALRFGLGRGTTAGQIDAAVAEIARAASAVGSRPLAAEESCAVAVCEVL